VPHGVSHHGLSLKSLIATKTVAFGNPECDSLPVNNNPDFKSLNVTMAANSIGYGNLADSEVTMSDSNPALSA